MTLAAPMLCGLSSNPYISGQRAFDRSDLRSLAVLARDVVRKDTGQMCHTDMTMVFLLTLLLLLRDHNSVELLSRLCHCDLYQPCLEEYTVCRILMR